MIPPSDLPKVNKLHSVQNNSAKSDNAEMSSKVKDLRGAIANGTYQINTKVIAERIVQSGILKE